MERSTVQSCLAAPFIPLKSGTAVKEDPTAVGRRSARINIDIDWNRSNCRTHRSSCCQRIGCGTYRRRTVSVSAIIPPARDRVARTTGTTGNWISGTDWSDPAQSINQKKRR